MNEPVTLAILNVPPRTTAHVAGFTFSNDRDMAVLVTVAVPAPEPRRTMTRGDYLERDP